MTSEITSLSQTQRTEIRLRIENQKGRGKRQCMWCGWKVVKQADIKSDETSTKIASISQALKECSLCFVATYCSTECQTLHWYESDDNSEPHRKRCKQYIKWGWGRDNKIRISKKSIPIITEFEKTVKNKKTTERKSSKKLTEFEKRIKQITTLIANLSKMLEKPPDDDTFSKLISYSRRWN